MFPLIICTQFIRRSLLMIAQYTRHYYGLHFAQFTTWGIIMSSTREMLTLDNFTWYLNLTLPVISSGHSFVIGRSNSLPFISTFAARKWPSRLVCTRVIRPKGHCYHGRSEDTTITTWLIFRSGWIRCHFFNVRKLGSHSFNHLFQKCRTNSCILHQHFLGLKSV